MSITTEKVRIGLIDLHFAELVEDSLNDLTYQTPFAVPGIIRVDVNPNASSETLFTDNKPSIVYSTIGAVDVEMEKDSLPDDLLEFLLGRNTEGAVSYITNETAAPYVAMLYRQTYDNDTSSFVRLYKGKFMEGEMSSETKGDSVNFQTGVITAQFVATTFRKTFGTKSKSLVMATVDEESDDYANEGDNWFTYVVEPVPTLVITTFYFTNDPNTQTSLTDGDVAIPTDATLVIKSTNEMLQSLAESSNVNFILQDGVGTLSAENVLESDLVELRITPGTVAIPVPLTTSTDYTLIYNIVDRFNQETGTQALNFTTA
jgi:phi13 family phage major tail protein